MHSSLASLDPAPLVTKLLHPAFSLQKSHGDMCLSRVRVSLSGLLAALAQHTSRVNSSVLQNAAVAIFACTPATAKAFAEAMKNTMAMCLYKALKATSGKKLSAAVRAVCLAMADPRLTHLHS